MSGKSTFLSCLILASFALLTYAHDGYQQPYTTTSYTQQPTIYPWIEPCSTACAGCIFCYQVYHFYYPFGLDMLYCNNFGKYCPMKSSSNSYMSYSAYSRGYQATYSSYSYLPSYSPSQYGETTSSYPVNYEYPEWYIECYQYCFDCLLCYMEYGFYYKVASINYNNGYGQSTYPTYSSSPYMSPSYSMYPSSY
ncbi:hypothetical protein GpartN1_g5336.t1 [Galdieria partita]|uniref:Uncharacterized protein n=1 Tax=Galdieria partita TaxID=83374 RepID=A0A9C7PQY8_9RHOD|nr:hypothetical protein GpartN1_g819.t1 [Galdieria partita]GJQ13545.1 hypothetical protein GpartN1_g5336.t1 [Galdieria partita]